MAQRSSSSALRRRRGDAKLGANAAIQEEELQRARNVAHESNDHHEDEPNSFIIFMVFNLVVGAFIYGLYYFFKNPMASNILDR